MQRSQLVLLLLRSPVPPTATHRSTPVTTFPAASLLSPVGGVQEATALRWGSVSMADQYRVTLYQEDGTVLFESLVADTFVLLPDSVRPAAGGTYFWTVAARTGYDRWVRSNMAEFHVAPERRP